MWKAPNRPKNEITQAFNDGIVNFYTVENVANPGYAPVEKLNKKILLRYSEQRLGINRLYLAKQAMAEVQKVIRIPRAGNINPQDVAITEDGEQYIVETVQTVPDIFPPCLDVSLSVLKQRYEVI